MCEVIFEDNEWRQFRSYIIRERRHVFNKQWTRFLENLSKTSQKRGKIIKRGEKFHRVRLKWESGKGNSPTLQPCSDSDIGAPSPDVAVGGRANPKGVSCLYLASQIKTAIAEKRPYKDAFFTVGVFEIIKDLKVLDIAGEIAFSFDKKIYEALQQNPPGPMAGGYPGNDTESIIWGDINFAFSVPLNPVNPANKELDYIPAQILAERLREGGFEGICYKSSLDPEGNNLVVFNPGHAQCVTKQLFQIKKINYEYTVY